MPIKILHREMIYRIAAGEVVERPASVVKELVENSLDAGSSQIDIEVRNGGVSFIRVSDNGCGIPSEDVELAFSRYATSKIDNPDDLEAISTLGFRGEALPSIAAVAQVEIVTSTESETGTYLRLENGSVVNRSSRGRSQGTTVTVHHLFQKVPARLKFLKSRTTENSHIAEVVSQYALSFPEVRFSLSIDGRTIMRTPGSGQLIDSIVGVHGDEIAKNMLEIDTNDEEHSANNIYSPLLVTGMVGLPAISRTGRGNLSFFVNRRWINSRLLTRAVLDAYHGMLMQGKYPVAIINVSIPYQEVDANIHPTKAEIKFRNEQVLFYTVNRAVNNTLSRHMTVPEIKVRTPVKSQPARQESLIYSEITNSVSSRVITPEIGQAALPVLRVIGQLSSSYIIAEGPDGMYLIDQHAAHERILFDRIYKQSSNKEIEVQGLLEPATYEVAPSQEEVLRSYYQNLVEFGFSLEPFGDRTYLVRAVPLLLCNKNWKGVLGELLESLSGESRNDWREKVALSIACHSGILAGQTLNDDEMREMVRQLEQTDNPHTCPHGRPTMIHLSAGQLQKEFGRT